MSDSHGVRRMQFVIFFSVFFSLYALLNSYIFWRGWQALPDVAGAPEAFVVLYVFLSLSFLAGRFLERVRISWVTTGLVWIGSYWLAAMAYFYIALLSLDALRLLNTLVPFFPSAISRNPDEAAQVAGIVIVLGVLAMVMAGHLNALRIRVRNLDLGIEKKGGTLKSMNIVAVSDIHLGTIIGKKRLAAIVEKANSLNPDLILLPGDVVDEDLGPVIRQNLGEMLRSFRSKYGVVAVTGNHEYIGGVEEADTYLSDHGIVVLRDQWISIADGISVVGREDVSRKNFSGKVRKPLAELMEGVDRTRPVILMDHQPFRLHEAVEQGVDLQLSGHTHHGQIWPFQLITKRMYEVSWGYKKKGKTHFYVSCGVGTWGPPVRIGNTPEIVNIKLTFQ